MRNIKITLAAFALLLLLSGCGAVLKGPKMSEVYSTLPKVGQGSARVHFMRPAEKSFGGAVRVHIDEKRVVELPLSGCHFEEVTAGEHELMIDVWGDFGSHEMSLAFEPKSNRFFKIWPRKSRLWATVGLGVIGAAVNAVASDSKNDGSMEMLELPESEALPLLEQCVHYKEENQ